MATESNYTNPHWERNDVPGDGRLSPPTYPELPGWLHELYPFHTRTFELADERMSLVDEGPPDAPAVVLLHDSPGWSFEFRRLIPLLAGPYRVIAPDLVGFGLSSKPQDRFHTLPRHIEAFSQLIQALNLREFALLLHGWGGPIGMDYAVRNPQNLRQIVLTNTWAMPLPHATNLKLPTGVRIALGGRLGRALDSWLKLSVTSGITTANALPGLAVEGYKYPYEHRESTAAVRCFWKMLRRPDEEVVRTLAHIAAGLGAIKVPVDIVWGRKEATLGNLPAYLLRDKLRTSCDITFLDEASHFVAEDAPEALAATLLGALGAERRESSR